MTMIETSPDEQSIFATPETVYREQEPAREVGTPGGPMDEKITYRQQVSFCGKPRCRKCRDGIGHGPYWFAYSQTPEGRTVRTYIGKQLPPGISAPVSSTASDTDIAAQPMTPEAARDGSEIEALNRLLAQNSSDEATALRLMIALAKAKRRGEALRIYKRYTSLLQSHTGRTPSLEMQDLYETIQRGEDISTSLPEPDASNPDAPHPDAHKGHPYISTDPTSQAGKDNTRLVYGTSIQGRSNQSPLVGRDGELERLRRLLSTAQHGMAARSAESQGSLRSPALALQRVQPQYVVLMGESGIGKTRLA
ncbi:MAG TPA: BTAD domain-containing putative transcriptional regulator, partial [Ktedonobacteraceae bacterium]|nr:BTAD domain-containing putative transcriptional regulator [Ktedonobacteraceae bacterium]